jgi:CelD/BcsL family acetyltransferase involved in cellulose biosynthesis
MSETLLAPGIDRASAGRPRAALQVAEIVDRREFAAIEAEWNALVEADRPEPFYRHEYVRNLLDHFASAAPLEVVTLRDARGRLVAGLPLVAGRGSICGIGVRELASPTNVHSLRFDLVSEDSEAAAEALFDHLAADRSWDVIRISDVPAGGRAWRLHRAAQAAGFPVGAWEAQRSPYITLPSSYGELLEGRRAGFKANLRRRRRRLGEQGEVRVERFAGEEVTERRLEECLVLERSGWKGGQGSAVSQSEAAHGFHLGLLRSAGFRDHLSLFRLTLDGQPIAFHYGLTCNGVYSLVLTSYLERFKEFSPGHLLTGEVLEDCISRGLREFDFLGCDLPWKLEWTHTLRSHHWLYVFRDSLFGRSLRLVKFGWVPAVRRRLGARRSV